MSDYRRIGKPDYKAALLEKVTFPEISASHNDAVEVADFSDTIINSRELGEYLEHANLPSLNELAQF